jgi:putative MFS transporter
VTQIGFEYGKFLDSLPMNRRHWTLFAVCSATFAFDALDFQIMSLVAPSVMKEWSLKPQELGFVLSSTAFGMLVGAYLFGILGDKIGRRAGFQITVAIFALFSGLCMLAENSTQLAMLRFATGIGIGGFIPIDTAMMSEFMPARRRGQLMAWFALFFPVGGLLAATMAKIVIPDLGWRALFAVGVLPAIMVLLVRMLVPESPRFLIGRGRLAEARKSIAWIADGVPAPDLPQSSSGIQPSANISELFGSRYRVRTIMLTGVWFFWAFSYFGLLLWLPSLLTQFKKLPVADVFTYIIGFQLAGIAGRLVMSFLVDVWGRVKTFALCAVGAAAMAIVFGQQTSYEGLLIAGYALAFFHDGGQSGIAAYAPELYPTRVRTTGVGWANGAARIAAFLSPIAIGYLVPMGIWAPFAILAAGYLLAGVVIASFRIETMGLVLEDAALETEG